MGAGFQAGGLLGGQDHLLDFGQGAGERRAARWSGSRLKAQWPSGQYRRAMRVPAGLLRV